MANWYYYNTSGEKVGPIRGRDLSALAKNGTVTPETVVENEQGQRGKARKVKGLIFPESTTPKSTIMPSVEPNPFTASLSSDDNPFTAAMPSAQQQLYPQYQQQPPVISTGTYLWIIFMGYILDPHNKTIVDRMTPEQRAILFRWRLCVAGCCLLCLILLFLFFRICS